MTTFEPTPESIQMMLKQVEVSEEDAKQFLVKCKGNVFNAICCALGDEDLMEDTPEEDVDIADNHNDPQDRISQFRNILDKKDEIFAQVTKKEEDILEEIHNIGFIPFTSSTNKYTKENYRMTLKSFMELIAKPFIETGKLEEYKSITFKEIQQDPEILGKKKVSEDEMKEIEEANAEIKKDHEEKLKLEQQLKELEEKKEELEEKKEYKEEINGKLEEDKEEDKDKKLMISDDPNIEIDVEIEDDTETTETNIEATITKDPNAEKTSIDKSTEAIRKKLAQYIEDKLEIRPLIKQADKMVKKWRCNESGIVYNDSNIKTITPSNPLETIIESKIMNKLATKLMRYSDILTQEQYYVGNVIIIDKWYHYTKKASTNETKND